MKLNYFVVFFCLTQIKLVSSSECTTSQNERLEHCYYKYLNSFGISEDSRKYIGKVIDLAETWNGFLQVCKKVNGLHECLGGDVMKNCIKIDEFNELFDNGLEMIRNYEFLTYICGRGFELKRQTFDCMKKGKISCEIFEDGDCLTLKTSLIKCANEAKKLCGEKGFIFHFNQMLASVKSTFPQCHIQYIDEKNTLNNNDENTFSSDNIRDKNDNEQNQKSIYEKNMFILFEKTIKMLSNESFTKENLIKSDVLPLIVESLKSSNPSIQLKAIEVLTMISNKGLPFYHSIIQTDAIPPLIKLIESTNFDVFDAALDFLDIIVKSSHRFRNYCIKQGILEPLIKLATNKETSAKKLYSIATIIKRMLYHGVSPGSEELISSLLPTLNTFINHKDSHIQVLAVGSYNFILNEKYRKLFVENGIVAKCFIFLETSKDSLLLQLTLRFFQIFIDENSDSYIQYFINNNGLKNLHKSLKHYDDDVKLEAISLISSFVKSANGTQKHEIFNEPKLLPSIISLLDHKNPTIRTSTIELLLKIVSRADPNEIISMTDSNLFYQFCSLLKDYEMPEEILQILQTIMYETNDEIPSKIVGVLRDCDASYVFKELMDSDNLRINNLATILMSEFYDVNFWDEVQSKSSHDEL